MYSIPLPPEILMQILSYLTVEPPPFYFDRLSPYSECTSTFLNRQTLISLCLVNKAFHTIASERLNRAPRFLKEGEEKRLLEKLHDRQKRNDDDSDIEIRELYINLKLIGTAGLSLLENTKRWIDRYNCIFTLLTITRSKLTSLRLDSLNNRYVRDILEAISSPFSYNSSNLSTSSLKSLALSGNPHTNSFPFLTHRLNRPYFLGLKELRLSDLRVPLGWKWEEVEGGRPKYQLQTFEVWGMKWEVEALRGTIGLQGTESETDVKPIEGKREDQDDDCVYLSSHSPTHSLPPAEVSSGQPPASLRHLTLALTHSAHLSIPSHATHFSILTFARSSLVSLFLSLDRPITSYLSSLSPYLKELTSLRSLTLYSYDFPSSEEMKDPWFEKEVVRKLELMKVAIEEWQDLERKREGLMEEMRRWKRVMGTGRVILEEGFGWKEVRLTEI